MMVDSSKMRCLRMFSIICLLVFISIPATLGLSTLDMKLMEAAVDGDISAARSLLNQGANAAAQSDVGETPLHVAGICSPSCPNDAEMVELLLENGADVDVAAHGPHSLSMRPLHWYVHPGYNKGIEALIKAGADVNAVVFNEAGDRITALDICDFIGEERKTVSELLIGAGAKRFKELEQPDL